MFLVHGIGRQLRGDTLVAIGEPLQTWIAKWTTQLREEAAVVDALIAESVADLEAPAHAALLIPPPVRSDDTARAQSPSEWLLAESWWGGSFTTPRYVDLAYWGFQVFPWTIATHFGTRARRVWHRIARGPWQRSLRALGSLLVEILYLLLALVALVPLLTLLILLVLVLGIVPIPRLRRAAGQVQRLVSSTLGDSFVLLASPVQRQAIVGQVDRDLQWLARRCDAVAVVAHSQGAAVAHEVLRRRTPSNVRLFMTYGSGLNKLAEIETVRNFTRRRTTALAAPIGLWLAPAGLITGAFAIPALVRALASGHGELPTALIFVLAAVAMFASGIAVASTRSQPDPPTIALPSDLRWVDLYASADPVPNGGLFDPGSVIDDDLPMSEVEVHNTGSLVRDHTAYWSAPDDFVGRVATLLAELVPGLELSTPDDELRLEAARLRRRWRVRWLHATRLLALGAVVSIPLLRREDVARYALPFAEGIEWLFDLIPWFDVDGDSFAARLAVGAVEAWTVVLAVYLVVYGLWRWWSHTESQRMFLRQDLHNFHGPFVAFLLAMTAGAEVAVLVLLGWSDGVPNAIWQAARVAPAFALSLWMILGMVVNMFEGLWPRPGSGTNLLTARFIIGTSVAASLVLLPALTEAEANGRTLNLWWLPITAAIVLTAHLVWRMPWVARLRGRLRPLTHATSPIAGESNAPD